MQTKYFIPFVLKMLESTLIIALFSWIEAQGQTCRSSYSQPNMKLQGHVIKTYSALQTSDQCIDKCALHADCHSINYCSSQGICEVNNANHLSNPEGLVYSAGCQYLNYFLRAVLRCSSKLCSYPLECATIDDTTEQEYMCITCQDKHKVLKFPGKTTADYVIYENPFNQLTAFTLSMWVQVDTSTTFHAVSTYATTSEDNELSMEVRSTETRIMINNGIRSFPAAFDGQWHHFCLTWTNADGSYSMYIDGISKGQGTIKSGHVIQKGAVVLGQEQDAYKGGFSSNQALQGNLTSVNMWNKVLTAEEVSALAHKCSTAEGNVIKWTDFHDKTLNGNLKLTCSRFCDN